MFIAFFISQNKISSVGHKGHLANYITRAKLSFKVYKIILWMLPIVID
jgi:hypothetical protein